LRKLLRSSLLLEGCVFLEDELLLLLRSSQLEPVLAEIFSNALASALAAFARDTALECRASGAAGSAVAAAAASSFAVDVGIQRAGQDPSILASRLHSCSEVAREAGALENAWDTSLARRQELVRKALELLAAPQRSSSKRSADAAERKAQLQLQMDTVTADPSSASGASTSRPDAAAQEQPLALEREVLRLEERQREIRGELDDLSQKIVAQQEMQRTHLAQEEQRRSDLEEARSAASRHECEVMKESSAMDMKQAECSTFLEAMQQAQAGMLATLAQEEVAAEAELENAVSSASSCHEGIFTDADRRLDAAAVAAARWLAESERAAKTLELLGVEVQDGELPHRKELPAVLRALRLAWEERRSLSESYPQRTEVETMMEKLASEAQPLCPSADALGEVQPKSAPPSIVSAVAPPPTEADSSGLGSRRSAGPPRICVQDLDAPSPLVSPSGGAASYQVGALEAPSPLVSPSGGAAR